MARAGRGATTVRPAVRCVLLALAASCTVAPGASAAGVGIQVLSSRPDLVTGGDARMAITLPPRARRDRLRVTVAGRDVTGAFDRSGSGRVVGLVTGLPPGPSTLRARVDGEQGARLRLVDHPSGGPLFAGPQVQPWACTTAANGLGAPATSRCDAAHPVVRYVYKRRDDGQIVSYDPASRPDDDAIARTTTDDGRTVPFVVRVERGTLDRSIYDVAMLDDPAHAPTPAPVWDGKLFVPFGGACSSKHSQTAPAGIEVSQSAPDGAVLLDRQLSRGYAVATTGLSTLAQNCNPVVSAEALSMLKEHIVEAHGPITSTIGEGCSGGSIQMHTIADAYPGLLDGIIPSCSFPDLWSPVTEVADCTLLQHYFTAVSPQLWLDPLARQAVAGSQTGTTCPSFVAAFGGVLDPADRSSPVTACDVPAEQQYEPTRNPRGERCSIQDYAKAIWGPRPQDGFARRPIDNVGVQYGLEALRAARISPEQFVDLNTRIGGLDIDGHPAPQRMRADAETVRIADRADQVVRGKGLAELPILDLRGTGNNEVHTDQWSYATRARLLTANGTAGNQVIWTTATDGFVTVGRHLPTSPGAAAFDLVDRWVGAVQRDHSGRTRAQKVLAARPADAQDACFTPEEVTDPERCAALYPSFGNPRTAAGEPRANDVVACVRAPLERRSYGVDFTAAQWARLLTAFPEGACDWAATKQRARPEPMRWPTFAAGPGGEPLGPVRAAARFGFDASRLGLPRATRCVRDRLQVRAPRGVRLLRLTVGGRRIALQRGSRRVLVRGLGRVRTKRVRATVVARRAGHVRTSARTYDRCRG